MKGIRGGIDLTPEQLEHLSKMGQSQWQTYHEHLYDSNGKMRDDIASLVYFWMVLFAIAAVMLGMESTSRQLNNGCQGNIDLKGRGDKVRHAYKFSSIGSIFGLVITLALFSVVIFYQANPIIAVTKEYFIGLCKVICFFGLLAVSITAIWAASQGLTHDRSEFNTDKKYHAINTCWWLCLFCVMAVLDSGVFSISGVFEAKEKAAAD